MLNKIYIKILSIIIYFIDIKNKKKIINFFKKKLNKINKWINYDYYRFYTIIRVHWGPNKTG